LAYLSLSNVGVDFVLYQTPSRSIKRTLLKTAVGGKIGSAADSGKTVVRALNDFSLDLRPGDRLALVGHNGAGKTTLLRVMAGIYAATSGTVSWEGARVPLFDIQSGFEDEATGYENIILRGLLMGFGRREMESKIDEIAAFSELGDYLNLPVRTYSSGMIIRLLFSIATSGSTDILLMDEWIAAGDREFLHKANVRLKNFVNQAEIVVLASHNPDMLRETCNRAVLISGGRLVQAGPVDEVLEAAGALR
jgi:ABC-2 type transport system ATP-binding protein